MTEAKTSSGPSSAFPGTCAGVMDRIELPVALRAKGSVRVKRAIGDGAEARNFGINLVELPAGARSALPHWRSLQNEHLNPGSSSFPRLAKRNAAPV
jgi:hypothetical protein